MTGNDLFPGADQMFGSGGPILLRAIVLYLPIVLATAAGVHRGLDPHRKAAAVISSVVTAVAVLGTNALAVELGWWTFAPGPGLMGVPVEVLIGWTALWGTLPSLLLPVAPRLWHGALMVGGGVGLDVVAMPMLEPVVVLGPRWLVGEVVVVVAVLIPSITISTFTLTRSRLWWRGVIQAAAFTTGFVLLPPAFSAEVGGPGLGALLNVSPAVMTASFLIAAPAAVMALWAFAEFLTVGKGTPIPLDPPVHLVTSGPYARIANPMQTGSVVLLLAYALMLGSWQIAAGVTTVVAFFCIAATAVEKHDLGERFGDDWISWRRAVRRWIPLLHRPARPAPQRV